MAPDSRRRSGQATTAEISISDLKSCFVHLPASLCSLLVNSDTLAQNVIVELDYRPLPNLSGVTQTNGAPGHHRSIFVGWTGMQSKRKLVPIVGRDGISGTRGSHGREQEIALVEIDAAFARTLGLSDGQKVTTTIHIDPQDAHTVTIEPLTPEDWEIIELHARFLEINFVQQIRALPNPNYTPLTGVKSAAHPLTLHLSPTSTANIIVTALVPEPSVSSPFAKLNPEAEVFVAPKTRVKTVRSNGETRSVASKRSGGARSGAGSARRKSGREEANSIMFFRGLDRKVCEEWFSNTNGTNDTGLKVWIDRDILFSKALKGVTWVLVTVLRPASLKPPLDPQKEQRDIEGFGEAGRPTTKVVARLMAWDDPPDRDHIALSSALCSSLACEDMIGGLVRIEAAPSQSSKSAGPDSSFKSGTQVLKVYPFSESDKVIQGLKFGGESKVEREEAADYILKTYSRHGDLDGLLDGPLTDGMLLGVPNSADKSSAWRGGILKFGQLPSESQKQTCNWFLGSERRLTIEVQAPIEGSPISGNSIGDPLPLEAPILVGIDDLMKQLKRHLSQMSSVLLTGALGSGKSSAAQLIAYQLRRDTLFHTTYFSCRQLVTDESRVSVIKETFTRLFMAASWGARPRGKSLVILDDLDRLCTAETELEVGNEARSRQISEGLCAVVRHYCGRDKGVVLLVVAQAKESLHNVIVSGHVVKEIMNLKAPNKEGRRRVIEMVVRQNALEHDHRVASTYGSRPTTAAGSDDEDDGDGWMDGTTSASRDKGLDKNDGFIISRDLDFLDLAGETDGYMPGDLLLLVGRARSEALMRCVAQDSHNQEAAGVELAREDFTSALKGFTPASLRNVTLQTSTTTFASIGGLYATRKILLETLQYPTTYAPIFAQCPLRLRSGLLLYGYPGCGKTMLASAVAGECGLNFISVKGPEILNKYIGASEKSVRDLFERAEAARPCVLFFDEFDSIAPKRGHDSTGVTDRVVNQLLTQMDGAEGLSGVYVLAATSRPDLIDPALLRPGRLDKSLICDLPDFDDRVDILRALGRKLKLSEEVIANLSEISSRTVGYSGADLQALVYNAHLEAIHDVLGDHDTELNLSNKTREVSTGPLTRKFIQFRYDTSEELKDLEERARLGHNKAKVLAEQAAIAAKLQEIKAAKRRAKLAYRGGKQEAMDRAENREEQEVIIGWRHVECSLKSTRPSISTQERNRLKAIYREFIVGRNGEMRDGEGAREVGGRSSLM